MTVQQRIIGCLLAFSILLSIIIPTNASTAKRLPRFNKTPARIILSRSEVMLSANQSVEVSAKVLDTSGNLIPTARIVWTLDTGLQNVVRVEPLDNFRTAVLITAKDTSSLKSGILHARSGATSTDIVLHLQNPIPREIVFPDGNKIELPIGVKKTVRAYVLDEQGNRIRTAGVYWNLADPQHEAFVLVGSSMNKDGINSVDISWLPGKPDLKTPSEVRLIALSGNASGIVTIDYKASKPEKVTIILEPKQIFIGPGESTTIAVTARGEDERVLKVEPEAEIADENAKKYIMAVSDKKTVTVIGSYGDPKTTPPILVRTALIVKAGGGIATIPVVYQREPATVDWDLLPPNIVGQNYGRTLKKDYYCIEVTIQNNSGSDLALAGLRFNDGRFFRPPTGYSVVHGSLARRQLTHPRSLTMAIVDSLGSLMTGFNPFFHNANHAKNYSQFIDILSNPLAKGLKESWKDPYPDELARFEQDVLRDDKIIPNGGVFKTRIFVPKRALFTNDQKKERDNLDMVRLKLGTLWVLGYKFQKGNVLNVATSP